MQDVVDSHNNGSADQKILRDVNDYYTTKIGQHGATPRGVDWNSQESQELRFAQLLKLCDKVLPDKHSLLDYGCGYGALARYLNREFPTLSYIGFDISSAMLDHARHNLEGLSSIRLIQQIDEQLKADFAVASGIFNVKLGHDTQEWQSYILQELSTMARVSRLGFSFNMLTAYSDSDRMRPDLYYADPHYYFDYCRTHFSPHVALLHDYPLYEFTIIVRAK